MVLKMEVKPRKMVLDICREVGSLNNNGNSGS